MRSCRAAPDCPIRKAAHPSGNAPPAPTSRRKPPHGMPTTATLMDGCEPHCIRPASSALTPPHTPPPHTPTFSSFWQGSGVRSFKLDAKFASTIAKHCILPLAGFVHSRQKHSVPHSRNNRAPAPFPARPRGTTRATIRATSRATIRATIRATRQLDLRSLL